MKMLVYLCDSCISAACFGLENFLFDKPNGALNKKFMMSNRGSGRDFRKARDLWILAAGLSTCGNRKG